MIDAAFLLPLFSTLTSASATPEERRAAAEEVLRELAPALVAALGDRPVAAGLVTVAVDVLDKAEGGLTVGEGLTVLGDLAKLLTLGRGSEERPRAARKSVAEIVADAKARGR